MRSRSRRPMARIGSESSALTKAPQATHLEELRAWMASQDLTAAYITQPVSIAYLTGVRADPFERLMALAVKPDRATLILPAIERENAERAEPDTEIVSWRDGEDPYGLVHQALEDSARLGVEKEHMTLAVAEALRERLQTLAFDTLVLSGPNSALPHGRPSGQRLVQGELVLLDFGAAYEGYCADTTRVAVVGAPTARQREIHALVLAAHDAAIDVVRAGATTGDVDSAARNVIEAAGLGDRFFHRTGHGLGLEPHEDPSLDPGSKTVLEVGMVFTVEPGIYVPGWGGVRIEDDVVVEADGCRLLTKADRSLRTVPRG